jgi:hypothetical protein
MVSAALLILLFRGRRFFAAQVLIDQASQTAAHGAADDGADWGGRPGRNGAGHCADHRAVAGPPVGVDAVFQGQSLRRRWSVRVSDLTFFHGRTDRLAARQSSRGRLAASRSGKHEFICVVMAQKRLPIFFVLFQKMRDPLF